MIRISIGNTVLYLTDDEADILNDELESSCHEAELLGNPYVFVTDLLSLPVTEAKTAMNQLSGEKAINWKRDGF